MMNRNYLEMMAYFYANTDRAKLEAAELIPSGKAGDTAWKRFNHDFDIFILKLPSEKQERLAGMIDEYCARSMHPDDLAVDRFAAAMKAKLAAKRAEGYHGWDDPSECTIEHLSNLLRKHVNKGDPIDVGNFAMMIHQRGKRIMPALDAITKYYTRQIEWSKNTFGPALRTNGVCNHIRKELIEIEAEPHDLSEWVDVIILAMDGFWRHGGTPADLLPYLQAKQDKNFARTWPDWRSMSEDTAIEHDRSAEGK